MGGSQLPDQAARPEEAGSDLRLLADYLRPERARLAGLTCVLLVAMLAPVAGPVLLGAGLDRALAGGEASPVPYAVGYLVVSLGGDLLRVIVAWWSVELAWRVGNRLRLDLARHALQLDLEWHSRHRPGVLIERIDGDVEAIVRFSSTAVLAMLGNAVLLTGTLAMSLVVDWRAGLTIIVAAVAAIGITLRMRDRAVASREVEREVKSNLYGDLEERLGGLEDLRANGAGPYAVHKLRSNLSHWWHAARRAGLRDDGVYALNGLTFTAGKLATLGIGIWAARLGQLSVGSVLALLWLSQMTREPLEAVAEQLSELHKATAGARRASDLLATQPAVADGPGTALPDGPLAIDFTAVGVAYANGHRALDEVDLHVPAGTSLGVVGRTGSGKTSLVRLLTRLWDATEGTVRLGGVDLRETTHQDLRRRVAVISQDVELFTASLRDNLTYYGALGPLDDTDLWEVLAAVGMHDWAVRSGDHESSGLDAVVDPRLVSAGEAQLLAFARVLLTDPGLVVLDEATSRLDPVTEARISAATDRVLAGRTGVVVAHRLKTLDRVDTICVVDGGRIVEHGPRADLAGHIGSRYAELLRTSEPATPPGPDRIRSSP